MFISKWMYLLRIFCVFLILWQTEISIYAQHIQPTSAGPASFNTDQLTSTRVVRSVLNPANSILQRGSPGLLAAPQYPQLPAGSRIFKYLHVSRKSLIGHVLVSWDVEDFYVTKSVNYTLITEYFRTGDCQSLLNSDKQELPLSKQVRSYELKGIRTWASLAVTLRGEGEETGSVDHMTSTVVTHETAPTGKATNITTVSVQPNSAQLSWQPPSCESRGGLLQKYDVEITSLTDVSGQRTLSSDQQSVYITGLQPYTDYQIRVSYVNGKGAGPYSDVYTFQTSQGPPSAPIVYNFTYDDLSVGIIIVQPIKPNGQINQYHIQLTGGIQAMSNLYTPMNGTEYVIVGLQPNTSYIIRARARNDAGWGDWSHKILIKTKETVKPVPSALRQTLANATCIGFQWAPPQDTGDIAYTYKILISSNDKTNCTFVSQVDNDVLSFTQCGLSPYSQYSVRVQVMKETGQVGHPLGARMWTEGMTPPKPRPPVVRKTSTTTITTEVFPVLFDYGPITSYEIRLLKVYHNHTLHQPHPYNPDLEVEFHTEEIPLSFLEETNPQSPNLGQVKQPSGLLQASNTESSGTPNIKPMGKRSLGHHTIGLESGHNIKDSMTLDLGEKDPHVFLVEIPMVGVRNSSLVSWYTEMRQLLPYIQSSYYAALQESTRKTTLHHNYSAFPKQASDRPLTKQEDKSSVEVSNAQASVSKQEIFGAKPLEIVARPVWRHHRSVKNSTYPSHVFVRLNYSTLILELLRKGFPTQQNVEEMTPSQGTQTRDMEKVKNLMSGRWTFQQTSTSKVRKRRSFGNPPGVLWIELAANDVLEPKYIVVGNGNSYYGKINTPLDADTEYAIVFVVKSTIVDVSKHAFALASSTAYTKANQKPFLTDSDVYLILMCVLPLLILLFLCCGFFVIRHLVLKRRSEKGRGENEKKKCSQEEDDEDEESGSYQKEDDDVDEDEDRSKDYAKPLLVGDSSDVDIRTSKNSDNVEAFFNSTQDLSQARYITSMRDKVMYDSNRYPPDFSPNNENIGYNLLTHAGKNSGHKSHLALNTSNSAKVSRTDSRSHKVSLEESLNSWASLSCAEDKRFSNKDSTLSRHANNNQELNITTSSSNSSISNSGCCKKHMSSSTVGEQIPGGVLEMKKMSLQEDDKGLDDTSDEFDLESFQIESSLYSPDKIVNREQVRALALVTREPDSESASFIPATWGKLSSPKSPMRSTGKVATALREEMFLAVVRGVPYDKEWYNCNNNGCWLQEGQAHYSQHLSPEHVCYTCDMRDTQRSPGQSSDNSPTGQLSSPSKRTSSISQSSTGDRNDQLAHGDRNVIKKVPSSKENLSRTDVLNLSGGSHCTRLFSEGMKSTDLKEGHKWLSPLRTLNLSVENHPDLYQEEISDRTLKTTESGHPECPNVGTICCLSSHRNSTDTRAFYLAAENSRAVLTLLACGLERESLDTVTENIWPPNGQCGEEEISSPTLTFNKNTSSPSADLVADCCSCSVSHQEVRNSSPDKLSANLEAHKLSPGTSNYLKNSSNQGTSCLIQEDFQHSSVCVMTLECDGRHTKDEPGDCHFKKNVDSDALTCASVHGTARASVTPIGHCLHRHTQDTVNNNNNSCSNINNEDDTNENESSTDEEEENDAVEVGTVAVNWMDSRHSWDKHGDVKEDTRRGVHVSNAIDPSPDGETFGRKNTWDNEALSNQQRAHDERGTVDVSTARSEKHSQAGKEEERKAEEVVDDHCMEPVPWKGKAIKTKSFVQRLTKENKRKIMNEHRTAELGQVNRSKHGADGTTETKMTSERRNDEDEGNDSQVWTPAASEKQTHENNNANIACEKKKRLSPVSNSKITTEAHGRQKMKSNHPTGSKSEVTSNHRESCTDSETDVSKAKRKSVSFRLGSRQTRAREEANSSTDVSPSIVSTRDQGSSEPKCKHDTCQTKPSDVQSFTEKGEKQKGHFKSSEDIKQQTTADSSHKDADDAGLTCAQLHTQNLHWTQADMIEPDTLLQPDTTMEKKKKGFLQKFWSEKREDKRAYHRNKSDNSRRPSSPMCSASASFKRGMLNHTLIPPLSGPITVQMSNQPLLLGQGLMPAPTSVASQRPLFEQRSVSVPVYALSQSYHSQPSLKLRQKSHRAGKTAEPLLAQCKANGNESRGLSGLTEKYKFLLNPQSPGAALNDNWNRGENFWRKSHRKMHAGKSISFREEFKALERYKKHLMKTLTFEAAFRNPDKNRFSYIIPPDHTRVNVEIVNLGDCDYYNASYIHLTSDIDYIAAQCPFSPSTVNDLWRMILQNKVATIVLLCNCVESAIRKCEQYWADVGVFAGANVLAETTEEQMYTDFLVRTLKVVTSSSKEVTVTQFQFQTWPLSGVPDDPMSLLELRYRVRRCHGNKETPILVMCGTGVARSAVFIAVDVLIEDYARDGYVNVYTFVKKMRRSRPFMVRTFRQYKFIYECLLEEFQAGDTVLRADMRDRYRALCENNPHTGVTFLMDQFRMLSNFTPALQASACSVALLTQNQAKNVDSAIIPPDLYRPQLNMEGHADVQGYINAVFIDGCRRKNEFMITQTPMINTVYEFWRMIYDYQIHTIVMLGSCTGNNKEHYFPVSGARRFAYLMVEHVNSHSKGTITIRNLKLCTETYIGIEKRAIRHVRLPENADMGKSDKVDLLDLREMMMDWQMLANRRSRPIAVVCSDGATNSGLFCACAVLCERFCQEGEVDLYHTVKRMKRRRPQIVDDFDRYRFLHHVLWEYITDYLPTTETLLPGGNHIEQPAPQLPSRRRSEESTAHSSNLLEQESGKHVSGFDTSRKGSDQEVTKDSHNIPTTWSDDKDSNGWKCRKAYGAVPGQWWGQDEYTCKGDTMCTGQCEHIFHDDYGEDLCTCGDVTSQKQREARSYQAAASTGPSNRTCVPATRCLLPLDSQSLCYGESFELDAFDVPSTSQALCQTRPPVLVEQQQATDQRAQTESIRQERQRNACDLERQPRQQTQVRAEKWHLEQPIHDQQVQQQWQDLTHGQPRGKLSHSLKDHSLTNGERAQRSPISDHTQSTSEKQMRLDQPMNDQGVISRADVRVRFGPSPPKPNVTACTAGMLKSMCPERQAVSSSFSPNTCSRSSPSSDCHVFDESSSSEYDVSLKLL